MKMKRAITTFAAAACVSVVAVAVPAASGALVPVRAPSSGKYTGRGVDVYVSGRSIMLFAASFRCGSTSGRTSLDDIPIRKTRSGYSFHIRIYGSVTFANYHTDQNGLFNLAGAFSRNGRRVTGTLRVSVPYCGKPHTVRWSAMR
jgi:hypothetical protein